MSPRNRLRPPLQWCVHGCGRAVGYRWRPTACAWCRQKARAERVFQRRAS